MGLQSLGTDFRNLCLKMKVKAKRRNLREMMMNSVGFTNQ